MTKGDIVILACLALVVAGLGYIFFFAPEAPQAGYHPVELAGSSLALAETHEDAIVFSGTLVEGGFITIHQSYGGAPGPTVAASGYIEAGAHDYIRVTAPLVLGYDYVALLHVDNGNETFVMTDDLPVTAGGQTVRVDFPFNGGPDATE